MTALFVAGAGTDVGKTHVACGLLRAAAARGLSVAATKPVMSGVDPARLAESDAGRLLAAMGRAPTDEAVAEIAPWRFAAPLAPTAAARAEGRPLRYEEVFDFCCLRTEEPSDLHVVEAAGGVMSPIAEGALCVDLAADLGLPVLLVAGAWLGGVSHALTAIEAVERRGLRLAAVVVCEARADGMRADELIAEMRPFTAAPLSPWTHGQEAPGPGLWGALSA